MAAYVLVQVDVRDPATYEQYKKLVPPSLAAYGGRFLVRGGKTETLEGPLPVLPEGVGTGSALSPTNYRLAVSAASAAGNLEK